MQRDVIIVDNFYKDPDRVVEYAKHQKYYYPYQQKTNVETGKERPLWMTSVLKSRKDCPFRSSVDLIQKLEQLTGDTIDKSYWNRDQDFKHESEQIQYFDNFIAEKTRAAQKYHTLNPQPLPSDIEVSLWNCAFHIKTEWDTSEAIHNHIEDYWQCCGELGWNGIIYFSKNVSERAGIKFWKHKFNADTEWMTDHERWNLIDELGSVYNRLILFRGKVPHSGTPGFGSSIEDGRLFQTFFFRTIQPPIIDPVNIELNLV